MKLIATILALALLLAVAMSANGQGTQAATTTPSGAVPSQATGQMGQTMCSMMSVSVDDRYVYLVRGSQLLKFDKNNMQLISQGNIPAPAMATMPGGAGAGPSGQMGMMMKPVSSSVDSNYVYVAQGNELLKFNKNTLQLVSRTALPSMTTVPGGAGAGPALPSTGVITSIQPTATQSISLLQSASGPAFDQAFLRAITVNYTGEIAFAQLADDKAVHQELQDLGKSLSRDLGQENETFAKWGRSWYNIDVVPSITPADQQLIQEMNALSGANFEIAVMNNLIYKIYQAQQMAFLAQQKASKPELRNAAQKMIDQENRQMAWFHTRLQTWYNIQVMPSRAP